MASNVSGLLLLEWDLHASERARQRLLRERPGRSTGYTRDRATNRKGIGHALEAPAASRRKTIPKSSSVGGSRCCSCDTHSVNTPSREADIKGTTRLEKLGGSHTCPQEVQREATKSTTKWIGAAQRRLPKVHPSLYLINAGPVSRSEHLSARLTISCISGKQAFRYQKRSVGHGAA